jgi:NADH dehydrogenase
MKRVVIIGAGFGGLWAAKKLAKSHDLDVLLIDKNNYHVFLPLLYQVAAAELEPEDIIYPIRSILRKYSNARFSLLNVRELDLNKKTITGTYRNNPFHDIKIPYDYCIIAMGSTNNFFQVEGANEFSFPLKTMEEAIILRNHILCTFERAAYEENPEKRKRMLTFIIVGGGPTGVEYAGALSELIYGPLVKDYPNINFNEVRIILLEALNNLLMMFPEKLRVYAFRRLKKMKIEVLLNTVVDSITTEFIKTKNNIIIPTESVVWTAGVKGQSNIKNWGLTLAKNCQIVLKPTLQVLDNENIYVVGDLARLEANLPMIAPVAIQQGEFAAMNILRQIDNLEPISFKYKDKGSMVTIGRNSGVAEFKGKAFSGFFAWLVWIMVHIFNLIGFRNRLFVIINWAWDYLFFERAVRLILPVSKTTKND